MRPMKVLIALSLAALPAVIFTAPASAQATRTWVSGVGDDVNPCSRTAPCKTFAGAISKTAAGGEINCLDPAGYGALTITKSISVVCDYTEGGVLAGGNGIVVNALATDRIYLSGLEIKGVNPPTTGIRMLSAAHVTVKNCVVRDFITGIEVAPASGTMEVDILNSVVTDNTGIGINVRPTGSGNVRMSVTNTQMLNNTSDGIIATTNAPTTGTINVAIRDSVASNNGGSGFAVFAPGTLAQMMLDTSLAMNNAGSGIIANGTSARVRFARSNVTGNVTGVSQVGSGVVQSYTAASNTVDGNTTDGTFGTTPFK
jgi:hypothetical protein